MLNLGFRRQLKNILDLLPPKRQSLLFSATLVPEVVALLNEYFANPIRIEAAPAGTPVETIIQTAYEVPNFYTKVNLLKILLAENDRMAKVLVFVVSKKKADLLYETLEGIFPGAIGVIHSNKEQNHRFHTVRQFKEGTYRILIATDIVARGIDISEVTHVINFDLPATPENYIHRIGRTGRADNRGMAISFISEKEQTEREVIEQYMKTKIALSSLPANVEVSAELTEEEQPTVYTKEIELKVPKKEAKGAAFHQKSAKNSKVNKRVSRKAEMKKKYGKPIKKGKK
jgi:ATP-dependent RNA helicase RhlE